MNDRKSILYDINLQELLKESLNSDHRLQDKTRLFHDFNLLTLLREPLTVAKVDEPQDPVTKKRKKNKPPESHTTKSKKTKYDPLSNKGDMNSLTFSKKNAFCIQRPSREDLTSFKNLPTAHEKEDQLKRITKFCKAVPDTDIPIKLTHANSLSSLWHALFKSISSRDPESWSKFQDIDPDDPVKKALLACHHHQFVQWVIQECLATELDLDADIVINNRTFQALIQDFATTIENFKSFSIIFSIGLPGHHAAYSEAAGFCIFNKASMLIHHFSESPVIICGFDVNADNGSLNIFSQTDIGSRKMTHIDLHDSRVYPYLTLQKWTRNTENKGKYAYRPYDFKDVIRKEDEIHPYMVIAVQKIRAKCKKNPHTLLIVHAGFDSHAGDLAFCSRGIFGIDKKAATYTQIKPYRFQTKDFKYFYNNIHDITQEYNITVYMGLEGGYTKKVNDEQIALISRIFQQNKSLESQKSSLGPYNFYTPALQKNYPAFSDSLSVRI